MNNFTNDAHSIIENNIQKIKEIKSNISRKPAKICDLKKNISYDENIEKIVLDTIKQFENNFNDSQAFFLHKEFLNASSLKISYCSLLIKNLILSEQNEFEEEIEDYFDKLIDFYVNSFGLYDEFIKTKTFRGETIIKYQIELGITLNNIGDACLFLANFEEKNYEKIHYFKLGFKMLCEGLNYFKECFETNKDFFSGDESKKIGSKFRRSFGFSGEKIMQCYEQLASFLNKKHPPVSNKLAKTGIKFYEEFENHFKKKFSKYSNLKDSFENIEQSKQKLEYYLPKKINIT